jgi:pre-mRNA-splicing factor SYF2
VHFDGGGVESIFDGPFRDQAGVASEPETGSLIMTMDDDGMMNSRFAIALSDLRIPMIVIGKVVEGMDVLMRIGSNADGPNIKVVGCGRQIVSTCVTKEPVEPVSNEIGESHNRFLQLRLKMNKAKQLNNQAVLAEKQRLEDAKKKYEGHDEAHRTANSRHPDPACTEKRDREMGFYPDSYARQKRELGESEFYHVSGAVVGHRPSEEAKNRLVESLKKDQQYHRKRVHDDDAVDIEWINDRNKAYTKKLDKAYGKFTADIKFSLERGTNI